MYRKIKVIKHTHTHTHTHIYIYIYIYMHICTWHSTKNLTKITQRYDLRNLMAVVYGNEKVQVVYKRILQKIANLCILIFLNGLIFFVEPQEINISFNSLSRIGKWVKIIILFALLSQLLREVDVIMSVFFYVLGRKVVKL